MANNRNRTAGHKWERACAKKLMNIGFNNIVTTRMESKSLDNAKVDLTGSLGERLPINIQCKTSSKGFTYAAVLDEMPQDNRPNIVFLEVTKKASKNFVKQGEYAILKMDDLLNLLEKCYITTYQPTKNLQKNKKK